MKHPNHIISGSIQSAAKLVLLALVAWLVLGSHSATAQAPDPIVGRWRWFSSIVMEFNENGTVSGGQYEGTWKRATNSTPPTYEIDWNGRFFDTLRMIKGGKELKGKNNKGEIITAERVSAI